MKTATNKKLPKWAEAAFQGLAFWIGHRRAYYRHHDLGESAVVGELCNLINANMESTEYLHCEVQYADLLARRASKRPLGTRADLVVGGKEKWDARCVIEVKRSSSPTGLIDEDLVRLQGLKRAQPSIRAFLVVVSEGSRPRRYVSDKGVFDLKFSGQGGVEFSIRRAWKASASFKNVGAAHYVCVLEVK